VRESTPTMITPPSCTIPMAVNSGLRVITDQEMNMTMLLTSSWMIWGMSLSRAEVRESTPTMITPPSCTIPMAVNSGLHVIMGRKIIGIVLLASYWIIWATSLSRVKVKESTPTMIMPLSGTIPMVMRSGILAIMDQETYQMKPLTWQWMIQAMSIHPS